MNISGYLRTSAFAGIVLLLCFFRLFSVSGYTAQEMGAIAPSSPLLLTTPPSVKEYFITCSQDSFALIYENFREDLYITATVTFQDKTWTNVRLRLRGDSSREFPKKSLKLKFDGEAFANGRAALNFNAEYLDNSYIHSILSSHLFSKIGYPCFHAEPARLYLNGKFLGLYISIENMDEDFLVGHNLDPKGNLYKATYDGACLSTGEDVYALWEKKTNEGSGREDLQKLIEELHTTPDSDYLTFAHSTFDYDKMVTILAMNMLLSNGSTYYHNYYMYHRPADNKWMMLPWDVDKTFTAYGSSYPYQRSTSTGWPDNPFMERALLCPPIFEDIQARTTELAETYFSSAYLNPIIDSIATVLAASVEQDTADLNPTIEKWQIQLQREKSYIQERYPNLASQFLAYPYVFRIEPTHDIVTLPVKLRWHRATDPNNDPLTYTVQISTKRGFPTGETTIYKNISDTTLLVTTLDKQGTYYWTVTASDGQNTTDGFDKFHSFIYRKGTLLQSPITGIVTLTEAESPYTANGDIIVEKGAVLQAEPGARLQVSPTRNIIVYGKIDMQGTAAKPVTIQATSGAEYWGNIIFQENSRASTLSHVIIDHGQDYNKTVNYFTAKINSYGTDLALDNVEFMRCYRGVLVEGGNLTMTNCRFLIDNHSELVRVYRGTARIENCTFNKTKTIASGPAADVIDLDSVSNGIVRNCFLMGADDDGIDMDGSQNIVLENNVILNCKDKGISIAKQSQAQLKNNTIAHCLSGIVAQNGSIVTIDKLTVYDTFQGCSAYHNSTVSVSNSIFSQSTSSSLYIENGSSLQVRYSLSDTDTIDGIGNIKGNPLFINPNQNDFHLQTSSPCVDAGDPASPSDPDGSRADMGAFYLNKTAETTPIVINEISYNQPADFNTDDWVELFNPNNQTVDISGWVFKDESDDHVFTFPNGTTIAPNGFLVVCEDTNKFRQLFPTVQPILGNTGFGLSGSGELVRLFNASGDIVDSLTYDDTEPWPTQADGNGPTLELISASLDNALAQSWKPSTNTGGTPGKANSNTDSVGEKVHNKLFFLQQNIPNPFSGTTTINYTLLIPARVTIELYDALGKPVRTLIDMWHTSGTFPVVLNADGLPSGHYFYTLRINGIVEHSKSAVILR